MVGMSGHALRLEDDERGDVRRQPAVDTSVELTVGTRVATPAGQVEQRDVRDAEHLGRGEQLLASDLAECLAGADGAGLALREAEHTDVASLAREIGEER